MKKKKYYPINLDVAGKRCVVIGSGAVARRKIKRLMEFGAEVSIVDPYEKKYLAGAYLVFAATDNLKVNRQAAADAGKKGIPVNVANPGRLSTFILPAAFSKKGFVVSVSTNGRDPKKAKELKERLKKYV